jgi:hypothetical protein
LEDNIKLNLGEKIWSGVESSDLVQDSGQWWALVNTVMNLQVP